MRIQPRAPHVVPKPSPDIPRAAILFIVSGFLMTAAGIFLAWGVPGLLIFLGLGATALGYRINSLNKL